MSAFATASQEWNLESALWMAGSYHQKCLVTGSTELLQAFSSNQGGLYYN